MDGIFPMTDWWVFLLNRRPAFVELLMEAVLFGHVSRLLPSLVTECLLDLTAGASPPLAGGSLVLFPSPFADKDLWNATTYVT